LFQEPDKLFKQDGKTLVMSAIIGKYICTFWYENPDEFRTISVKEFQKKIELEEWIQLN
jgi:hypothetical protein